jgi:hypothetical protein|tara:strand:+ start:885 stop:1358 length:474 start_codon:yes stop_codon:yes gene_type:complete
MSKQSYEEIKAEIDARSPTKPGQYTGLPVPANQIERRPTNAKLNRLRGVMDSVTGTESGDDLMLEVMNALREGGKVPTAGNYYCFVYQPKTPNIQYDQNPLVAVSNVFSWGFKGLNYHWGQMRQYTWDEIAGGLYLITAEELPDAREIPFQNIRINR